MTKKHLSLLVVFVMLFTSLFSSFAFAAEEDWEIADDITIKANYHVQTYGDKTAKGEGALTFGTTDEAKRLEQVELTLDGAPDDMAIVARTHVRTYGDLPEDGSFTADAVGTTGEGKRMEGIALMLVDKETGEQYPGYTISYQVHMRWYGWGANADQNWRKGNEDAFASDGEFAGTTGEGLRIEAISILIEKEAKLAVKDVASDNLKQVVVEFNQDVEDNDEISKVANYALEDSKGRSVEKIDNVNVDGNTAVLTLEEAVDNQTTAYLVVKKAVLGAEDEFEVRFRDFTAPTADDAEVIGEKTIKVVFSEPMDKDTVLAREFNVESTDGKTGYNIRSVTTQKNDTEALIELRRNLEDGDELVLTVKNGIKDYANFRVATTEFDLEVVEDNREIEVVNYKNASEEGVTLVFNKNIKVEDDDEDNFYHTNSKNTIDDDGVEADGNELELTFKDNELPTGRAYIYIDGDSLVDYWGNTNEQTIVYEVTVAGDTEAPTIKSVKYNDTNNTIAVEFSKRVDEDTAEDEDNYTLVAESDGKKVKDPTIYRATLGSDDKTVTLRLSGKALATGEYLLQVDGVEDLRGNELENGEKSFKVEGDALEDSDINAYLYVNKVDERVIEVDFGRKMDVAEERYSIDTLENYSLKLDGKLTTLESLSNNSKYYVDFEVSDDEESVEIVIEADKTDMEKLANDYIYISRVKDAMGILSANASHKVEIKSGITEVGIDEVKAIAVDKIEISLSGSAIDYFVEDDFVLENTSGDALNIDDVELSADGKKVTITLKDDLSSDAKYEGKSIVLKTAEKTGSESRYGGELVKDAEIAVADKIAPEFFADYDNEDEEYEFGYKVTTSGSGIETINLKFTEDLKVTSGSAIDTLKGSFSLSGLTRSQYDLSIDGDVLTITVNKDDVDKTTIKLVTENEAFADLEDNKVKTFEVTVYKPIVEE